MKNFTTYVALLIAFLSACDQGFEEINTNPNAPINVQPSLLLRQVIYDYGEQMSYEGFVAGNLLSQHFAMVDFNLFDRHDLSSPQLGGNPWPFIYTNMRDNQLILEESRENAVNRVYEGPALILKAFMAAALTDIYGDVPYFDALQGRQGNTTPIYDRQEDIYLQPGGVLDNLERGIQALSNYDGPTDLEGDILFDGDLDQWIRFANSLRIKYLIRISSRQNVSSALQVIADEGLFIKENRENAVFDFSNTQPNTFRMAILRSGDFNLFVMSETMQEIMDDLNDPRVEVFFRASENNNGQYRGLLNGPDASTTSISVADFSLTGRVFREQTGDLDANFMTAWETNFLLAEAAVKGFVSGNPQVFYELAVRQAFEYWGLTMPPDYLTVGIAAYGEGGQDPLNQIITQKWIANSINGYEGWIEYRRTGLPQLKSVAASLNENQIPVRLPYPADEAALNAGNYQLATQGNDNSVNFPVWWDN